MHLQILLIILAILFAGIMIGLIICSLGNDTPVEALCGWWMHPEPRRKRRTTIGANGEVSVKLINLLHEKISHFQFDYMQVEVVEESSTESYDGPPLDPVSKSKERREPMSWELEPPQRRHTPPPPSPSPTPGPSHAIEISASPPASTSHTPQPDAHSSHGRHGSPGAHGSHGSHGRSGSGGSGGAPGPRRSHEHHPHH